MLGGRERQRDLSASSAHMTVGSSVTDIVGKSVIVPRTRRFKDAADGNSGARVECGVLTSPDPATRARGDGVAMPAASRRFACTALRG